MLHHEESPEKPPIPPFFLTPPFVAKIFRPPHFHQFCKSQPPPFMNRGGEVQTMDIVFQHFMDELKHCNLDMGMDLQLLVTVFLCLHPIYLVVMLPFRMIFFQNVFCFIFFPYEFAIF